MLKVGDIVCPLAPKPEWRRISPTYPEMMDNWIGKKGVITNCYDSGNVRVLFDFELYGYDAWDYREQWLRLYDTNDLEDIIAFLDGDKYV